MAIFDCFCGKTKKKDKAKKESSKCVDEYKGHKTLQIKLEHPVNSSDNNEVRTTSFTVPVSFGIPGRCKVKVMSHESPVEGELEEVAYEGEDEHDETLSMKRDNSDLDLQARSSCSIVNTDPEFNFHKSFDAVLSDGYNRTERDDEESTEMIKSGHISDPGIGRAKFWDSPKLTRSCSDVGMRDNLKRIADQLPPSKTQSFEEMQMVAERLSEMLHVNGESPKSVLTNYSADKVMLKKHSSSQLLPSRSRRLWWKLLLWSHRNLNLPETGKPQQMQINPAFTQQGGYCSDTLETRRGIELSKSASPSPTSFTGESSSKGNNYNDNQSWDGFRPVSGLWPQNQWMAFPAESSTFSRVDEWVKELPVQPRLFIENDEKKEDDALYASSQEIAKSPTRTPHANLNIPEEILHANSVIHSLNSSSTVAHIAGIGLKVIPTISRFSSLRSVNLSSNFIVHISPGSLPKGLHTLNLSRNKINTIEGLRELTRLRVLDLSYNRISRIGQGLSNCTLIKELYLAGNKISDVEGLHRLLKLTVLDLSFNKITTTKALGQLVANYNSLLAVNILGNPIQSNINEDQLRKTVCSLLPKLAYLNKQPINPQKAREVGRETIARAALGNSSLGGRRKAVRRVTQGGSASTAHRASAGAHRSRNKLKAHVHHHSFQKGKSSTLASSSH